MSVGSTNSGSAPPNSSRILDVAEEIEIRRDPATVRRQFGDLVHHERAGVHRGVHFEVLEESEQYCRYRQTTKLGPLRLSQELRLDRTAEGPLVNRVLTGPFSGATIGFDVRTVTPAGDCARVRATLRADLRGIQRLLAPILRRNVAQALAKALAEDKTDLEHGGYLTVDDRRSNFGHPAT